MSQFPPNSPGGPGGPSPIAPHPYAPVPPRLSALAVLSLVFGLLFCIPVAAPALGLLFGIIALVAVARSQGRVRGQGLAIAGVVISVLVLCAYVGLGVLVYRYANVPADLAESFLHDVADDDFTAARTALSRATSASVTDDELTALQRRLADKYGALRTVAVDFSGRAFQQGVSQPGGPGPFPAWPKNWSYGGPTDSAPAPIPIKLTFARGHVYGILMMTVEPISPRVPPLSINSIILVTEEGTWTFPPVETPEPAPVTAE